MVNSLMSVNLCKTHENSLRYSKHNNNAITTHNKNLINISLAPSDYFFDISPVKEQAGTELNI